MATQKKRAGKMKYNLGVTSADHGKASVLLWTSSEFKG